MQHLSSIVPSLAPSYVIEFAQNFDVARIGNEDAAWIELSSNLDTVNHRLSQVCHSSIKSADWYVGLSTWAAEGKGSSYYGGSCSAALRDRFNDWFINRSWCAPFIEFVKDRVIVISGELPANLAVAILSMQRTPREHGVYVKRMFDYVDSLGCSEDLAFAITFLTRTSDGGTINDNHSVLGTDDNHRAYIQNFLDRNVEHLLPPIKKNHNYRAITKMWDGAGGYGPNISNLLKAFPKVKVDSKKVVVPNPFAPVVKSSQSTITEAALKALIPTIMEYFNDARLNKAA